MKRSSKKRPVISRAEALACIPVRRADVAEERLGSGELVLTYPVILRPWLARLIGRLGGGHRAKATRKLQLDELGTEVWDLLNSRRTVSEVAASLAQRHRLLRREAEMAVTGFLRELGRRGLIGLR